MKIILFGTLRFLKAVAPIAFFVTGCAVGPNYHRPETPVTAALESAGGLMSASGPLQRGWWHAFNDPLLDRVLAEASTNNHDLRLAQARLREVRTLWTEARFDFVPTVRNEDHFEKSQLSKVAAGTKDRWGELYRAGFDATWELDLWGRVRRTVEAARATVESVAATRDDVLITVRAEVIANYFELRGAQAQLEVARRNATNQATTLKLAEDLLNGGQGTQLDVARARSLLNATLASIPPVEADIERAAHRIAVLDGRPPTALTQELSKPAKPPAIPVELVLSNPADLLRRRPDVRAAERSLAAATARIGVQVADLFPRVTVVGSIGLEASTLSGLGGAGSGAWNFGPHISWAAFDLGRVRQRIKEADARAEGALAIYERTALLALEETENSLVTLGHERQRLAYLHEAEHAGAEAVELARQRYRDGIADFLSVLDAERTLLSLQDQLVTSETRTATSFVALYKALAVGD